ncbi:hypothetical protein DBB29_24950 [Pandoraea cepalis]|uniref:Transposase n=1 Tax=Pandoraea cepalis TaxID=2508294 RepID=A0AAW7MGX5_9BURK|nr:hypothetical protein [Pandoraea cepalis]MDN4581365.1 hypothetical protein [Pandoraea cepalis]
MAALPIAVGKCALASVTVEEAGRRTLHRLPLSLSEWALDEVALARHGVRTYPAKIEFGCIADRHYAEIY